MPYGNRKKYRLKCPICNKVVWIAFWEIKHKRTCSLNCSRQYKRIHNTERLRKNCKDGLHLKVRDGRILEQAVELEKQGFRCIPITRVIPDIIAIKDGKVYAIEVEYGDPNYSKYTSDIKKYFDDVIWIVKKYIRPKSKN